MGPDLNDLNRRVFNEKNLYRIERVKTFVEVRIVYHQGYEEKEYTNLAEGDFPEWN